MKWSDKAPIWQTCLEKSWNAYREGSMPISAVVDNPIGNFIGHSRNHINAIESQPFTVVFDTLRQIV